MEEASALVTTGGMHCFDTFLEIHEPLRPDSDPARNSLVLGYLPKVPDTTLEDGGAAPKIPDTTLEDGGAASSAKRASFHGATVAKYT